MTFLEEPAGGPFSGIVLYDSTAVLDVNEGDELLVTGVVFEDEGMTEILVHGFEIFSSVTVID